MRVFTLGPAAEPGTEQAAGKETAEEVILQRLLRQMKLTVFVGIEPHWATAASSAALYGYMK